MVDDGLSVILILFRHIETADRRKFEARSNDASSGGGARDLRFRPEAKFMPFFRKMFPQHRTEKRTTKGVVEEIEILSGEVAWGEDGKDTAATMEIWPATNARPNEVRIARISSYGLAKSIKEDPNGGKSIFMMFKQKNGSIRLYFTTETSLRNDAWDPTIKRFAVDWLDRGGNSAFLDLETKERYPNA